MRYTRIPNANSCKNKGDNLAQKLLKKQIADFYESFSEWIKKNYGDYAYVTKPSPYDNDNMGWLVTLHIDYGKHEVVFTIHNSQISIYEYSPYTPGPETGFDIVGTTSKNDFFKKVKKLIADFIPQ